MTRVELFVLEVFGQLVMHSPLHITYIFTHFQWKEYMIICTRTFHASFFIILVFGQYLF